MKKFAVIDVGSNSVRLLFVADGKTLYKRINTTRLGEGIAREPRLLPAAIERTAQAIADFHTQAKNEGAEGIYCFATAAVRAAENRAEFLAAVNARCGLQVEVLSGEEEGEIGLTGALGTGDGGIVDIGGASTEIVLKKEGEILYKKSINIGVVRLKDLCEGDKEKLQKMTALYAKEFALPTTDITFYGIGGTATTIGAQYLGLTEYDGEVVSGAEITAKEMETLADKLADMTVEEIAALPCMPKGRADVIVGGAILLVALMKELKIEKITVSDRDNLEGYAIKRGLMR